MTKLWINGQPLQHIAANDRGFSYGDGLFETLRVSSAQPELLDAHLARLERGLERLRFPEKTLSMLLEDMQQITFTGNQCLKITLSRGAGERGYGLPKPCIPTRVIQLSDWHADPCKTKQGVKLRSCQYRLALNPALAGIKHLNRLEQVLARSEWQDSAISDGVVMDLEGYLVECTMSNIFWVKDGVVYTPSLDRCGVEGVMRNFIITCLTQAQIKVEQGRYRLEQLRQADEMFISNSLIHLWPVKQLDDISLPIGPVSCQLQSLLESSIC